MDDGQQPVGGSPVDNSGFSDADTHAKLELYHQKVFTLEQQSSAEPGADNDHQIDQADLAIFAFGLISELREVVSHWQLKREQDFEGKIYRTFTATLTSTEGAAQMIFAEVQLIFADTNAAMPMAVSVTETKPDENGALHECHFSAKYYSDNASEVQYVEYPYKQKEVGKPTINTKGIVVVARKMIQQLAKAV